MHHHHHHVYLNIAGWLFFFFSFLLTPWPGSSSSHECIIDDCNKCKIGNGIRRGDSIQCQVLFHSTNLNMSATDSFYGLPCNVLMNQTIDCSYYPYTQQLSLNGSKISVAEVLHATFFSGLGGLLFFHDAYLLALYMHERGRRGQSNNSYYRTVPS